MKKQKNPPKKGELGKLICVDKQGLAKLLHDYESDVKTKDEVTPFIDRYFECLRRFNLEVK